LSYDSCPRGKTPNCRGAQPRLEVCSGEKGTYFLKSLPCFTLEKIKMRTVFSRRLRRGLAAPEWACVVAGIVVTGFVMWSWVGEWTNEGMQTTASGVGNPASLAGQFGAPVAGNSAGGASDAAAESAPPGDSSGSGSSSSPSKGVSSTKKKQ
jgi:hypothetical protein